MLKGIKVFIGFPFNANGLLCNLVEDLGGVLVERPEKAGIIVALRQPEIVPDGASVFIPQGRPLEEFYLFCLRKKLKEGR